MTAEATERERRIRQTPPKDRADPGGRFSQRAERDTRRCRTGDHGLEVRTIERAGDRSRPQGNRAWNRPVGDDGALRDAAAGTTEPMRTYFDQNRLGPETDRRFHACDLERVGGYVQIVPTVVEQMAPLVDVGTWDGTRQGCSNRRRSGTGRGQSPQERIGPATVVEQSVASDRRAVSDRPDEPGRTRFGREPVGPDGFAPECFRTPEDRWMSTTTQRSWLRSWPEGERCRSPRTPR